MQTLYELLGALPEDNADSLRAAFRKAVKDSHPDSHPDDPSAPERFRRIVRANAILSDERQRATYDSLLAEASEERALGPERKAFREPRYRTPGIISSMVIASVSIGAFLLFERVLTNSIAAVQGQDMLARASALTASMQTPSSDTVGLVGEHNKPAKPPVASEPEVRDVVEQTVAPTVMATADDASVITQTPEVVPSEVRTPEIKAPETTPPATTASEPTAPEVTTPAVTVKDAKYYRERGGLAYRSGDLPLALVDFDLAIGLDPNFSDTYVDRAIVFRRMGEMKRALADIATAKRIDDGKPQ